MTKRTATTLCLLAIVGQLAAAATISSVPSRITGPGGSNVSINSDGSIKLETTGGHPLQAFGGSVGFYDAPVVFGSLASPAVSGTGQANLYFDGSSLKLSVSGGPYAPITGTTFDPAAPGAIGGTTPAAITGTTITATTGLAGPHNGTVGATTPAAITGTTITATTGLAGPHNGTVGATTPAAGTFSAISGPLNGTVGATTPAAGTFTALSSTSGALNGTLGATTPAAASVTTLTTSADANVNNRVVFTGNTASLSTSGHAALAYNGTNLQVSVNGGAYANVATGGSAFDPTAPGPIGGTTPGAGTFTGLVSLGNIQIGGTTAAAQALRPFVAVAKTVSSVTVATPGVFTTSTAHGFSVGDPIRYASTGGYPTLTGSVPLITEQTYFVATTPSSTTFTITTTAAGSALQITGAGGGTQTVTRYAQLQVRTGDDTAYAPLQVNALNFANAGLYEEPTTSDAAIRNQLNLRQGGMAQTFGVMQHYTTGAEWRRLALGSDTSGVPTIYSEGVGASNAVDLQIHAAGPSLNGGAITLQNGGGILFGRWGSSNFWGINASGTLFPVNTASTDLGATGNTIRDGFFSRNVTIGEILAVKQVQFTHTTLSYNASTVIDFGTRSGMETITLTGNVTFTTNFLTAGRCKRLRIIPGASDKTPTFPGWVWIGQSAPTTFLANKTGELILECWGTTDAEVTARYIAQP